MYFRSFMGGSSGSSEQKEAPQQTQPQQVQQQPMEYSQQMNSNDVCFNFNQRFNDCMRFNSNNSTICQQAYDDLKSCQNKMV